MINFSNTSPPAINGGVNVRWQLDATGDISAYYAIAKQTIAPTAGVVTLDASMFNSFFITVNAAITSMSIVNPTDGQEITIAWQQDSVGHAVANTTGLNLGTFVVSTVASKTSIAKLTYNAADSTWFFIGQSGI